MALDASDRIEIHELYAHVAISFDTGDADGFAESFTPDGTFVAGTDLTGREALADYVRRRFRESPGTAHHISSILVQESDSGARGRAYGLVTGLAADGRLQLRAAGTYDDELVQEDGRWRIRHRRFTSRLAPRHVGRDLAGPPVTG